MIRKAAATFAGLGLIGGAGSVAYDHHGNAVVKIKDASGHVQSVRIAGAGPTYSCPGRLHDRMAAIDIQLGRMKLTLQRVRRQEDAILRHYPAHSKPPKAVVRRFHALAHQDDALVAAYNHEVDLSNAALVRDCTRDASPDR